MLQYPERSAWINHIKKPSYYAVMALNMLRKHLLASLGVKLKMNSFRNASVTSEIATNADYTRKLKLCFAVKVI